MRIDCILRFLCLKSALSRGRGASKGPKFGLVDEEDHGIGEKGQGRSCSVLGPLQGKVLLQCRRRHFAAHFAPVQRSYP